MTRLPWVWVCRKCTLAKTIGGLRTLQSVADAARLHGCIRVTKPASRREAREVVRVQVPHLLTAEQWRTVWDSLDLSMQVDTPMCRSRRGSCGHAETSHRFASVTQPFCRVDRGGNPGNCVRCP